MTQLLALVFLAVSTMRAQTAVDPSGHWEGLIHVPAMDVIIEVDLAKNASGQIEGTFSNAADNVRGFPLSNVKVDGTSITFAIKATGGGAFHANLSTDAKSMKGTFTTHGPDSKTVDLPFDLKRSGDARIEAASKSPAISKDLEGQWTGTIDVDGTPHRVGLKLVNHPDATATGLVISREGTEIPIKLITQKGSSVTLDLKNVGASYVGTLNAGATELAGTWTQGSFTAPLTFERDAPNPTASASAESLVDRWAKAVGGREKVARIHSVYREATIDVGGLTGTIKAWHTADGKYRKEEHVAAFSTIETFDGTSGTLQQGDLPAHTMAGAEIERAKGTALANSNAMLFAFFPERRPGTRTLEGDDMVLKPEGGIDWRVTLDPQTSLPKTMSHMQGPRLITVTFISYETVDGIKFEKEIHRSTGDPRFDAVIRFTKTVINPPVDAALFTIEAKKTLTATQ